MIRFKEFFKNRTIAFYITLGVSGLSVISGIVYIAAVRGLTDTVSWMPGVMMILAGVAFAALALFRLSRTGAAVLALLDFFAIVVYIVTVIDYILTQAMTAFSFIRIEGIGSIIACAVLMIICTAAANVFAWLRLDKQEKINVTDSVEGEKV